MNTQLAQMRPAWGDPVHAAQQTFRHLLDAMSRPGRIQTLAPHCTQGLEAPRSGDQAPGAGLLAVLLTLLDADTTLALCGPWADGPTPAFLRFHTGVRHGRSIESAAYVVAPAAQLAAPLWERLDRGTDEAPQRGATLVLELPALGQGGPTGLRLRGPGIADEQRLELSGVVPAFWECRAAWAAELPRGIDLILVCGDRLAAIPRSTRVEWRN